jgi:hypothetical protein
MHRIADAAGRGIVDLQQPEPEQANLNCSKPFTDRILTYKSQKLS